MYLYTVFLYLILKIENKYEDLAYEKKISISDNY